MIKNIFTLTLCIILATSSSLSSMQLPHTMSPNTPLLRAFPGLVGKLSHIDLGDFPTPVHQLKNCGESLRMKNLYIKRDDLSGKEIDDDARMFGGNKVRKLEFILADALNHGARTVLTFGCAGSNHATATATYAHFLGLRCIAMLKPQPNSPVVQRNLLLMSSSNAELHYTSHDERSRATELAMIENEKMYGDVPYQIPTGGSCALGVVGFVSAAFELKEQIERSEIRAPDVIYVTASSCATIAGLLLGVRAAGLQAKIIGVSIEPEVQSGDLLAKITRLMYEANVLLHNLDQNFPLFDVASNEINLVYDLCGDGYGLPTDASAAAFDLLLRTEHIQLDGTYTSKAFSALIRDAQVNRICCDTVVLFWDSYCGDVIGSLYSTYDYRQLPAPLWAYFEDGASA